MDNVVKQTELLEKTGVYDEDLKRRFALTLKYNGMKGKKVLVIVQSHYCYQKVYQFR